MQSRAVVFCCGAAAGLIGAVGLYKARPQLFQQQAVDDHQDRDANNDLFMYGYPEPHISTHSYTDHFLTYDRSKKIPVWVAECINKDMVTSRLAKRARSKFHPDPKLPREFCSSNTDYRGSGWSRGHMAPAGNYKHCQNSMDDTFLLTNIVPQNLDNNSGYWNSIEDYCRMLSKRYAQVNVISGPLFLPQEDTEGKKNFVKYEVIGENNVAVPTHLFKIILAEDRAASPPLLGAFVVPNEPIKDVSLTQFQVSLEEVEKHTGTRFHCKLDRSQASDLCAVDGCKIKSQKDWAIMGYKKRVQAAASSEELEKVWCEVQDKGVHDKPLSDLYNQKKANFASSS